tara:strand:+ start:1723 stop:2418 length:696 start_codon:yes stop_codon:yes gene_type:complete
MAHIEQQNFILDCFEIIKDKFKSPQILEIGSYKPNKEYDLRNLFPNSDFTGIDLVDGPGVDIVMDGENIDQLNKKFDIIVSGECFEHAPNWKKIFLKMIKYIKEDGYIIITCASKGRLEHGTRRLKSYSNSLGKHDYYLNLEKKNFFKNFQITKIFKNYFFYYNINSYDLYVILSKNGDDQVFHTIKKKCKFRYKGFPKFKNLKRFLICSLVPDRTFQNTRFFLRKFQKKS